MTGPSLLQAAVDELYSSPMAEFTARRKVLAAAARKSGEREIAGEIAALRRPTVSADTVNRLVRAAPDEFGELLELGQDLRAAEKALDGPTLRELSTKRRHLVGALADLAFEIAAQPNPSAAVRDEVTATLNAALADEEVADRLLSGALVTQAHWDGFGSTSLPELAAVLPMDRSRRSRPATASPDPADSGDPADTVPQRGRRPPSARTAARSATATATTKSTADKSSGRASTDSSAASPKTGSTSAVPARTEADTAVGAAARRRQEQADRSAAEAAAVRARAEAEQRRRIEVAQRESVEAAGAADEAREALAAIDRRISELSLQLAHERRLLADAQRAVRNTEGRERAAQLALTRAGGSK